MIERVTRLVKEILKEEKDINLAVDMTAGRGQDSAYILEKLKPRILFAFDIQEEARRKSLELIGDRDDFIFIKDSHENIDSYIKDPIDLAIYNLGYLPGSDKTISTKESSTIKSLEKLLALLKVNGRVIMTIYRGHDEGFKESLALEKFIEDLEEREFACLKLSYPNKKDISPYVIIIEKKLAKK
ncbi:MAG: class I SAM-dependent methyltransferase [Anaerococcus sp.]|nr:class I SAM-dependent methyltransferase [Anaerococcus sp.]